MIKKRLSVSEMFMGVDKDYAYRLYKANLGVDRMKKERKFNEEINKLNQYIESLQKSNRFLDTKGPMFDPVSGWNPEYRVFQSDLMSPIPLNPFEEIHDKLDVEIGKPLMSEDANAKGYTPFTWWQGNALVAANPVRFELQRAKAILRLYYEIAAQINVGQTEDEWQKLLMESFKKWRQWNYVGSEKPFILKKKYDPENDFDLGD